MYTKLPYWKARLAKDDPRTDRVRDGMVKGTGDEEKDKARARSWLRRQIAKAERKLGVK